MKIFSSVSFLLFIGFSFFIACNSADSSKNIPISSALSVAFNPSEKEAKFKDYWYQGKAEITSYQLQQARYGEIHEGQAVMVFVTEPFSKSKQVKLDNPQKNPNDHLSILKLNFTRKFNTGVYPYSTMQSVFTPVDLQRAKHSLKVTTTSQEWCGHTFQQLNLEGDHYENQLFSYFESEGDQRSRLEKSLLEDEVWNRIRIDPKSLPIGDISIIPSSLASRLKHFSLKNEAAVASLQELDQQKGIMQYQIAYKAIDRNLKINFTKSFPYEIISWEEVYTSGWGSSAQKLVTKAQKKKSLMLDYWSKNNLTDAHYRDKLGLE